MSPKSMNFVLQPTQDDILCGKDKYCLRHEGSRRFKRLVESYQLQYHKLATKRDKMNLTKTIFDAIRKTSARFLKFNSQLSCWEEISQINARDKISHALRHLKPNTRRKRKYNSSGVEGFVRMTNTMKLDNDLDEGWASIGDMEPLESPSCTSTMMYDSSSLSHNKTEAGPQFSLLDTVSLAYIRNQIGPHSCLDVLNGGEDARTELDFPTFGVDNMKTSLQIPRSSSHNNTPCFDPSVSNGRSLDRRDFEPSPLIASYAKGKAIQINGSNLHICPRKREDDSLPRQQPWLCDGTREIPKDYETAPLDFPNLKKQCFQIDSNSTNSHISPTRGSEDNAFSRLLDSWITTSMHSSHLLQHDGFEM